MFVANSLQKGLTQCSFVDSKKYGSDPPNRKERADEQSTNGRRQNTLKVWNIRGDDTRHASKVRSRVLGLRLVYMPALLCARSDQIKDEFSRSLDQNGIRTNDQHKGKGY